MDLIKTHSAKSGDLWSATAQAMDLQSNNFHETVLIKCNQVKWSSYMVKNILANYLRVWESKDAKHCKQKTQYLQPYFTMEQCIFQHVHHFCSRK